MNPDLTNHNPAPSHPLEVDSQFSLRLSRTRHDLQSAIGHILGFSEMLLEDLPGPGCEPVQGRLEQIRSTAGQMLAQIKEGLGSGKTQATLGDLGLLQRQLCEQSTVVGDMVDILLRELPPSQDKVFKSDLRRIASAARDTHKLACAALPPLSQPLTQRSRAVRTAAHALARFLPAPAETAPPFAAHKEGAILVVDDLEENRELLLRRLSRLGYSVQTVEHGQGALEWVAKTPVDLILLDIMMPGLDGFEVLQRLKHDPATQHIPVIMLSSDGEIETAVRCISLGADDFLPKPFNTTLLIARIESSLSKKRLRDQESAFLKRLQAEQDVSERLLLNILPKPIAERLKQGEKIIADSFAEVTVLFSDFVNFTELAATVAPKNLVSLLNEIFSAFDRLCEQHGLEKIKMIGDGYMAVGGVPTPCADHAAATADLALAMQAECARFRTEDGRLLQMRIGLNTGPVVAGVIGSRKFAYDLWGDTVNVAKRMEAQAPAGGILVMGSTYERLRHAYAFQPARAVNIKGKGEVLSYVLLGKAGLAAESRHSNHQVRP